MAMIAATIAAVIWPQQVRMRPTLLRIGCATTESDWLALRLTDQQVLLPENRSAKDWAIRKSELPAELEFGCSD